LSGKRLSWALLLIVSASWAAAPQAHTPAASVAEAPDSEAPELSTTSVDADLESRWYTAEEVRAGAAIYGLNCAVCHGDKAQGNFGSGYSEGAPASVPPPLDGSGHSAHHSLAAMLDAIDAGAGPAMPAFGKLLSNQEKRSVVAYFQSLWPADVYKRWQEGPGQPTSGDSDQDHSDHQHDGNT